MKEEAYDKFKEDFGIDGIKLFKRLSTECQQEQLGPIILASGILFCQTAKSMGLTRDRFENYLDGLRKSYSNLVIRDDK